MLFLLVLFFGTAAHAASYPWLDIRKDDVQVVESPLVDLALRVQLIDQAKESIDIASYDIRSQPGYTYPILKSLRRAALRGVHIRFLGSWVSPALFDTRNHVPRYLLRGKAKDNIEYMLFGGPPMTEDGWRITDGMHEKLFIVDKKIVLVSGRGFGSNTLEWLDTTFPVKGPLVRQSVQAFEELWRTVRKQVEPFRLETTSGSTSKEQLAEIDSSELPDLTLTELFELSKLNHWWREDGEAEYFADGKRVRGRLLHFDFIKQAQKFIEPASSYDNEERLSLLDDPIVEAIAVKLDTAKDVEMTILSTVMEPLLKEEIQSAARRGANVRIFTNGDAVNGVNVQAKALWILGLPDLDDTMKSGVQAYEFVKRPKSPWNFMHRKVTVIDDTVFFGSHNFNIPSSTANDEMSFEVENPELARKLKALFDRSIKENGRMLSRKKVHHERLDSSLMRVFLEPFIDLM